MRSDLGLAQWMGKLQEHLAATDTPYQYGGLHHCLAAVRGTIGAVAPIVPSQRTARLCAAILDRRDTVPASPFLTAVNSWIGETRNAKVNASSENGRANEAVVARLVARRVDRLGIDSSNITVASDLGLPAKAVAVDGMEEESLRAAVSDKRSGKTIQ